MPLPIHFKGSPHCSLVENSDVFFYWFLMCRRQLNASSSVFIATPHLIQRISLRPNPAPTRMCMTLKTREIMFVLFCRWQKCKTLTRFLSCAARCLLDLGTQDRLIPNHPVLWEALGLCIFHPQHPCPDLHPISHVLEYRDEDKVGLYGGWSLPRLNKGFLWFSFVLFCWLQFLKN